MIECDIAVIGAGPAGLMAAIYGAHKQAKTVIIDSNSTVGLKLLRTGGGRCNLTHQLNPDEFIRVFGDSGRFLRYSLHDFDANKTMDFFAKNGLKIEADEHGFCYPVTNRAGDVKRVLVNVAENMNVTFLMNSKIEHIEKQNNLFILQAPNEVIISKALIIATGGMSWPQTGSNGDGYKFAASFGHKIIPPKAALVPLKTTQKWMHRITGLSLDKVGVKAECEDKKFTIIGPMIFTDNGIGGPAVLDFSRHITDYLNGNNSVTIKLDLIPDWNEEKVNQRLIELCTEHPNREMPGILSEFLPRRFSIGLCEQIDFLKSTLSGRLTKADRRKLVALLKGLPVEVTSTRSINEATITKGGVSTNQVDDKTMMSKLCPGLFFAGEVIDVDGPCGGFNLQICWSTGQVAGSAAYHYVNQNNP